MNIYHRHKELNHPGWIEKMERRAKSVILNHLAAADTGRTIKYFRISGQHIMPDDQELDIAIIAYKEPSPGMTTGSEGSPVLIIGEIHRVTPDTVMVIIPSGEIITIRRINIIGWTTEPWIRDDFSDINFQATGHRLLGHPMTILN